MAGASCGASVVFQPELGFILGANAGLSSRAMRDWLSTTTLLSKPTLAPRISCRIYETLHKRRPRDTNVAHAAKMPAAKKPGERAPPKAAARAKLMPSETRSKGLARDHHNIFLVEGRVFRQKKPAVADFWQALQSSRRRERVFA